MKTPHPFLSILATLVLSAAAFTAGARPEDGEHRNRGHQERPERNDRSQGQQRVRVRISLDRAVAMAESRYHARVVRAETRGTERGVVYVLRMLNEAGRVWTVRINGSSGNFE